MITKVPSITVAQSVFDAIRSTIGSRPAETGGMLGGNPTTGTVTHYFFDEHADATPSTYTVDPANIMPTLKLWNREGIHLLGFGHRHPYGYPRPSPGDLRYANRILEHPGNETVPYLLIPIVDSPPPRSPFQLLVKRASAAEATADFLMRMFVVFREIPDRVFEVPYSVTPDATPFPVKDALYEHLFTRVSKSHDLHQLHSALVMVVGCGGGAAAVEDLVRAGVGRVVLVDPDKVAESNMATQSYYLNDVGRPKVQALRDRLLRINPFAKVEIVADALDSLSDDDVRNLLFPYAQISTRLLCGFTDSFWAQRRVNLLALTLGVPALFAQVYQQGAAAELVFMHPEITRQCARCILAPRFDAFIRDGYRNDVGTAGAQYWATPRLNALKLFAAMALLHHGSLHPFWGRMLSRLGQHNAAFIRCDPDVATTLKFKIFDEVFAGAAGQLFCDETVWRPQHPFNPENHHPEACPDCGGTGDLHDAIGRFLDTRAANWAAQQAAEIRR